MSRPTTRVLTVLELLQTHGRMSGAELARRLEVDRRTVRRYVAALEALGIPLTAERGRDGAYLLAAGFKLPPMMFTDDEAMALAVGLLAARGLGLAEAAPAVASAQAKLERVMPAPLKRRVRAVDETVRLDLSRSPETPRDNAALTALSAAAQARQRVRLSYASAEHEETERDFDPYGLAYRGGRWYVVGHCHLRREPRSFRLDRVRSVRSLDVAFERPPDFDALTQLTVSVAMLPRAHAVEVLLQTDLEAARREVFPGLGVLERAEAGVVLRGQTDDLRWFARELARLPFDFQVRHPTALGEAVTAHARRLLGHERV
ncbi:transcriptional regulator [Corallococcus sp. H22C18031201]|uniref:helix-turn-helix transcriptional regulator n=1 Tax=Citreicoccus inhibens TaxID=2849499 RepID=UPI000E75505E|nr:YafY family protein [Citreicoccus inhibens]MBU8898725.1 YafY family transcriptional regulator [Citreicoccus inhibens]RJS24099.1 transcriptional regulator [Corallococcus sp. H22C18031201]